MHLRKGTKREREHGQIMILFALALVVILGFAAIVVDLGMLRNNRQTLANALDSGALAGGSKMPVDGANPVDPVTGLPTTVAAINAFITSVVAANYPGIQPSNYQIQYRCLIGVVDGTTQARLTDIPLVCDPHASLGHTPNQTDFTGAGDTRSSTCNPAAPFKDKCNTVVVVGATTTQFGFGPAVGVNSGSTGVINAASCQGPCGQDPTVPVDLVIIADRTGSMSSADITNLRTATNSVLLAYNPNVQRVALGLTGPSDTTAASACSGTPTNVFGHATNGGAAYGKIMPTFLKSWLPVGLTGLSAVQAGDPVGFNESYLNAAKTALNPNSHLVRAINCFDTSGVGTNLTVPILAATYYLQNYGRPAPAKLGIIFETDGTPNYTGDGVASDFTCAASNAAATAAKNANITMYTIGFGISTGDDCPDASGIYANKSVVNVMSDMSTGAVGTPTCTPAENTDGDKFFCAPKTTDLTGIFTAVANDFANTGAKLISLYPQPIVTSISPSQGPTGTVVTVTGKYFTGTTGVSFGGSPGSNLSVTSDTQLTVQSPGGAFNSVGDVVVTTSGGSSLIVGADQYTFK